MQIAVIGKGEGTVDEEYCQAVYNTFVVRRREDSHTGTGAALQVSLPDGGSAAQV